MGCAGKGLVETFSLGIGFGAVGFSTVKFVQRRLSQQQIYAPNLFMAAGVKFECTEEGAKLWRKVLDTSVGLPGQSLHVVRLHCALARTLRQSVAGAT